MLAVVFLVTVIIAEKVILSFILYILFVKLSETKLSIYVTQKNF